MFGCVDKKCEELGWACVPIAIETYGNWGQEAKQTVSQLASRLATDITKVIADHYGYLNLTLMRAIARAILARVFGPIGCLLKYLELFNAVSSSLVCACFIVTVGV